MKKIISASIASLLPLSALAMDIHDLFDTLDPNVWDTTNGFSNGSYTDTYWRTDHASIVNGKLVLTQDTIPCASIPAECAGKPLASAEVKTIEHFNYGEVEVSMKAASGEGFITGFFKYTGPFEGNPQDEIDFEILGKDPTKLQLNYFVGGQGGHEKIIDLGFDASADFHTYRYVHTADFIEWYVDGILVHSVRDTPLPSHPGKIYMDLWAAALGSGTANYWAGNYTASSIPATAEFEYINIIAYPDVPPTPPPPLAEQQPKAKYETFNLLGDTWRLANGWSNGSFSATGWRSDHVSVTDGILNIQLDTQPCSDTPTACSEKTTASGEITSADFYGYGTVEARLQAAKGPGLVTSLFKFTGPWDGNPQDEIDIEILGKDTTKVQFNYFVNGVGGHEVTVDLGFDAAAGFHTYGFRHTPTSIEWLVDGIIRHSVTDVPVPSYPGKVMMNLWAAQPGTSTATYFAGTYDPAQLPANARYDYVHITQGIPELSPNYPIQIAHSSLVLGRGTPPSPSGSPVTQQSDTGSNGQRWYIETEDGLYRIRSIDTHQCLTLHEADTNRIELQNCKDDTRQKWVLLNTGNGFNLISPSSGRCLAVDSASLNENTPLKDSPCNGADSQRFIITGFSGGNISIPALLTETFALQNDLSGHYLDVEDSQLSSANIEGSNWYAGESQTWRLENISDNRYRLRATHSDKCLSLAYAGSLSGINVVQYSCSTSEAMQWKRIPKGQRTEWKNALNDLCLSEDSSGNISARTCDNSTSQSWKHLLRDQIPDSITPLINFATGQALGTAGANTLEGSAIEQQAPTGDLHQQWRMEHIVDNLYRLRAQHSNQCMSLAYKGTTPGIKIVQYSCTQSEAMLWQRIETEGSVQWVNAYNELCLSPPPVNTNTNEAQVRNCDNTDNQKWGRSTSDITSTPLTGVLLNAASGLNLEIAGESTASGANAQQGSSSGGNNQSWTAKPVGNNQYQLIASHSQKCLSLAYKGTSPGINVVQYGCTISEAMRWEKVSAGSLIEWHNIYNGLCLAVSPGDVISGGNVKALTCSGNPSSQWQFN